MEREADTTRERGLALAEPQAVHREIDGGQRGGTGGIDGQAGSVEIKKIRDPVGNVVMVDIRALYIALEGFLGRPGVVVIGADPDKDTDLVAEPFPDIARVFDRGPGGFQKDALLRLPLSAS